MNEFIAKYESQIGGVISGFDRLVFRGNLRSLVHEQGMKSYLWHNQVLLKEFGKHAERTSNRLKAASVEEVARLGRPVKYVKPSEDKEAIARQIVAEQKIGSGPVCVIKSVEPCWSYDIYRSREEKKLQLVKRPRQCLFLYHYQIHPVFGFMNARIQSWFPFPVQICINGREWLSRQMDREGLEYVRQDNCFPWLANYERAQQLLETQLEVNWPELLQGVAGELNPLHQEIFAKFPAHYYWSAYQTEWATDVVFRDTAVLQRLYPMLVHHGLTSFSSPDVMRFLGRRIPLTGQVPGRFAAELTSDVKRRQEGVRIKHRLGGNSIKLYDKAFTAVGNVLRGETTIHNVDDFRVYRPKEGGPEEDLAWRPMRRGIADLHRRAEVSQKANDRYFTALACVDDSATVKELTDGLAQSTTWNGKRVRALRPWAAEDIALLEAVNRGEFTINGLRNRDLQALLFSTPAESAKEKRRRSAAISRKLRLLRAHGLLQKVTRTHRYQVTTAGRKAITALLTARQATLAQLSSLAA